MPVYLHASLSLARCLRHDVATDFGCSMTFQNKSNPISSGSMCGRCIKWGGLGHEKAEAACIVECGPKELCAGGWLTG